MEFLIKEAGCDKLHLVRNKVLLTLSLEKRPPRSLVRKLLESKGRGKETFDFFCATK